MQTEKEDDDILFQNGIQVSRYKDPNPEKNIHKSVQIQPCIRTGESCCDTISDESTDVDGTPTENLDEMKQEIRRVTFMELLHSSPTLCIVAVIGWNYRYLQGYDSWGQAIIWFVIVVLTGLLSFYAAGPRLWFPHARPNRKGRSAVRGPCQVCSIFSRRLFLNTRNCVQQKQEVLKDLPVQKSGTTLLPESRWSSEDWSYLWLRLTIFVAVYLLKDANLPVHKYMSRQCLFQYLLNPFSPVIPWGNCLRESVYFYSLLFNSGLIDLFFVSPG